MKDWNKAKELYIKDHLSKSPEQPERRINALIAIEKILKEKFPEMLDDKEVFDNIKKPYFIKLYECLKCSTLSSAEKSVINGLYKFSN